MTSPRRSASPNTGSLIRVGHLDVPRHEVESTRSVRVATQLGRIHSGQSGPPLTKRVENHRLARECDDLSDWLTGPGDGHSLTALSTFDDLARVVPQIPYRDV